MKKRRSFTPPTLHTPSTQHTSLTPHTSATPREVSADITRHNLQQRLYRTPTNVVDVVGGVPGVALL
jgi:hypothetical protein